MSSKTYISLAGVWNFTPTLVQKLRRAGFRSLEGVSRVRFRTLFRKMPNHQPSELQHIKVALHEFYMPCRDETTILLQSNRAMRYLWRRNIFRYGQLVGYTHDNVRNLFNPISRPREATRFANEIAMHMEARNYVRRPLTSTEESEQRKAKAMQEWQASFPCAPESFIAVATDVGIPPTIGGLRGKYQSRSATATRALNSAKIFAVAGRRVRSALSFTSSAHTRSALLFAIGTLVSTAFMSLPFDGFFVVSGEVGVGLGEMTTAKEAAVRGEGRGVWRFEYTVHVGIDQCSLRTSVASPQEKDHVGALSRDRTDDRIGEALPAPAVVSTSLACWYGEGGIE